MKIESRGISITGVPRVLSMIIVQTGVSIQFEGVSHVWSWTFAELREFHAAISEALKHDPESPVAPVKPEKTKWRKGDPEPEGVTRVIDCDDDLWERSDSGFGWTLSGSVGCIYRDRPWNEILREFGPLRLPEDEK